MTKAREVAGFLENLPDGAAFVLVAQAGKHKLVMRSDSLEVSEGEQNWPRAVWTGLVEAVTGTPPADDEDAAVQR